MKHLIFTLSLLLCQISLAQWQYADKKIEYCDMYLNDPDRESPIIRYKIDTKLMGQHIYMLMDSNQVMSPVEAPCSITRDYIGGKPLLSVNGKHVALGAMPFIGGCLPTNIYGKKHANETYLTLSFYMPTPSKSYATTYIFIYLVNNKLVKAKALTCDDYSLSKKQIHKYMNNQLKNVPEYIENENYYNDPENEKIKIYMKIPEEYQNL
ncbi:hypothetical protein SAMN05444369_101130 [Capnocytophaga haemolytica]|jgi:hypothetical protein|uniref:Uncharacterized protein n=1 Tax=Capnocytophaga haemolytica TaxID=45243 RepID=A0AAX2GWR4_9FLAO|nr:hypothetical protein [Capnocytophaga haemolytica]AMD85241.1 hypothetical protein AXF12_06795 [Capnocytophaga haemolytica]SFN63462.1 hypothetical protein SAMN05444369_101130 [Capnocytophaga haemolytica]SNV03918.1 Uncharacterised protein [Capnocytophaga haemolytica]